MSKKSNEKNLGGKVRAILIWLTKGAEKVGFSTRAALEALTFESKVVFVSVIFCVTFACSVNALGAYSENKLQEEYEISYANLLDENARNLEAQYMSMEQTLARSYVDQLIQVDYTQLTKTPLKQTMEDIYACIVSLETLGLDENELTAQLYQALWDEYEEADYILNNGLYLYPYTDQEYALLAKIVMKEQGDNRSADEAQKLVACVVLNRQKNGGINGNLENPSILDIVREPGQYGKYGPSMTWDVDTSNITDKVWENTRQVLEHEYECPDNVLFQAPFKQGYGVYKQFANEGYGNVTYFCYGRTAE